jgi:BirA family transcriptional regulator, biotin operon repressor / biotin---[acetyl-CoA-carboxylase] ligase
MNDDQPPNATVATANALGVPKEREPYAASILRGEVLIFDRVASTNLTLRALAAQGAPEGTVVVADEQEAGRGRAGRSWHSPPGAGFYGSILLRPAVAQQEAQFLTFAAAVAVAETLSSFGVKGAEIKWPNDVLVAGKKVCGILVETSLFGASVEWAIVGVGINVTRGAVPEGKAHVATSLEEAGVRTTPARLRWPLLVALDRWYAALADAGSRAVLDRWEALAPMARNRKVRVDEAGETYRATTRGVTTGGSLRVEREDGTLVELTAADVSIEVEARGVGFVADSSTGDLEH